MTLPAFVDTPFRYKETQGVLDVATVITDLRAELLALGWTEPVGNTFQSPARADGIFFQFIIARLSATRVSMVVKDQWGVQVNNQTTTQMDVQATGSTVRYYTGPLHLCLSFDRSDTPEAFFCGVMEVSPETMGIPYAYYFTSRGPRDNTGAYSNAGYNQFYAKAIGATAYTASSVGIIDRRAYSAQGYTVSGAIYIVPLEFVSGSGFYAYGRLFQAVIVPADLAFGAEVTMPLDDQTTGVFKVAGFVTTNNGRLAFRKS